MLISEAITRIKNYCKGSWMEKKIEDDKTRDKILYGDPDKECTGIVTTIYASIDVIRKAHELGANFIISHEALFYNHGDHQDWLKESHNRTYEEKSKLLDEYGIVVWRFHDYIHSGIPYNGDYIDGIFYGLAQETGWLNAKIKEELSCAIYVEVDPPTTVRAVADQIKKAWNITGMKCIGNLDAQVKKIMVCGHVNEGMDIRPLIRKVDEEDINLLLPLELIDFTLSEYVKDSGQLGFDRAILAPGHFNLEEPGMKYILNYIDDALGQHIDTHFVQAGDMYSYL